MLKAGDKVKDRYGNVGTVIQVYDNSLLTDMRCGKWLHVTKAVKIK